MRQLLDVVHQAEELPLRIHLLLPAHNWGQLRFVADRRPSSTDFLPEVSQISACNRALSAGSSMLIVFQT